MARLVLDLLEQRLLGLAGAEAGDALERALVLVAQVGELLLLRGEALDVRLEVALARVELGRAAVERRARATWPARRRARRLAAAAAAASRRRASTAGASACPPLAVASRPRP